MKKPLFIVLFFCLSQAFAQGIDYKNLQKQDSSIFVCHALDSSDFEALVHKLEAYKPDTFTQNRHLYHYDLGMAYYSLSSFKKDSNYMRKAVEQMHFSLGVDPYYTSSLWNAALMHFFLNECKKSKYYLDIYCQLEKKPVDKGSVKAMRNRCR
jgi:hypothetical protein